MKIAGKVCVVTGAGSGIGKALAERFAAEGAQGVVCADLNEANAKTVAAGIKGLAVRCDVSSEASLKALVDATLSRFGRIDVFCSNAGIIERAGIEASAEHWHRTLEVNLMAHVYAAKLVVPLMLAQGGGYIVATASAAGLLMQPDSATYTVSKHAAVAFAEWLSITYGHRGVTVQALCPQGVKTKMLDDSGEFKDLLSHDVALEPEQVAEVVWEALADNRFLILPHPEVQKYYETRAGRTEAWLTGMRKLQKRFDDAVDVRA